MTLGELREIEAALEYGKFVDSYLDECEVALIIVRREIAEIESWIQREEHDTLD